MKFMVIATATENNATINVVIDEFETSNAKEAKTLLEQKMSDGKYPSNAFMAYAGSNIVYEKGFEPKTNDILAKFDFPDPKKCEHNWVLDGHNCGEGICSKCLKRPF